jgi:hypothetical protein
MAAVGRVIMRVQVLAFVVSIGLVLSACGKSASDSAPASQARWSEAQVDRLAGLRRNPDLTYRLAAHPNCVADSLLRSVQEVQTYKDAGDVVATNPDESVGVKISGQSAACQRLFAGAMARVR